MGPEQAPPSSSLRSPKTLLPSQGHKLGSRGAALCTALSAHSGSRQLTLFLNDTTSAVLLLPPEPCSRHQTLIVKSQKGRKEKLSGRIPDCTKARELQAWHPRMGGVGCWGGGGTREEGPGKAGERLPWYILSMLKAKEQAMRFLSTF